MEKTAMMELIDKLSKEYKNLAESPFESSKHDAVGYPNYRKGYMEALNSIANDIHVQMLDKEKEQLINAHSEGIRFMAGDSTVPQPSSIVWFRNKYKQNFEK